ncbi:MAG: arylamine N-acetyltransferase family protein [Acidimicrobiales bacterium]
MANPAIHPLSNQLQRSYLERIAIAELPTTADEATLRRLHRAHLMAVPFENLDIHIGQPIVLDPEPILTKIVEDRRGGFCYELNGSFAALLQSLGFDVTFLEARVHGEGGLGIRFDHLCLRVDLEQPFLVDVGFGALFMEPIVLRTSTDLSGADQTEGDQRFRIEPAPNDDHHTGEAGEDWFDLFQNDEPQYRFAAYSGLLSDFEPGCHYHQTSPDSHFTRGTVCTRPTKTGRVTLSGLELIETNAPTNSPTASAPVDGRSKLTIEPGELGQVLQSRFGVSLTIEELRSLGD